MSKISPRNQAIYDARNDSQLFSTIAKEHAISVGRARDIYLNIQSIKNSEERLKEHKAPSVPQRVKEIKDILVRAESLLEKLGIENPRTKDVIAKCAPEMVARTLNAFNSAFSNLKWALIDFENDTPKDRLVEFYYDEKRFISPDAQLPSRHRMVVENYIAKNTTHAEAEAKAALHCKNTFNNSVHYHYFAITDLDNPASLEYNRRVYMNGTKKLA